ncbi:MAG: bifunctional 23S rRNA (guanine(2069)-N(7))-methyltransferase RlmK/23S rRNA (guanine(2445)-N(2))-methyltransferase RlmL [Nannocystaceae bacterium]
MLQFLVTAPRRTETVLADELRELGAESVGEFAAGVRVRADLEFAYRVCLWSRVASRVLLPLREFDASDGDELYHEVGTVDWREHLGVGDTLAVDCTTREARISHSRYAALRVKDAVVDQFRARTGRRPSVDVQRPSVRLHLHLAGSRAYLSLDLAGQSLHRRGYRTGTVIAPLKENLAAAVLRRARWPQTCEAGGTLFDPMCGGGTLLIEAAMMATRRAPGLGRAYYGFLGWRGHDRGIWSRLVAEAESAVRVGNGSNLRISGCDADPQAVAAAQANVRNAGYEGRIHIECCDVAAVRAPASQGLVVVNPPYGHRLADDREVACLYRALGERLAGAFSGWHAAVLVAGEGVSTGLGRRIRRRHSFYNGRLDIDLLCLDPQGSKVSDASRSKDNPAAEGRVGDEAGRGEESGDASAFSNRLRKNAKRLAPWIARNQISCYRLYDADIPEFAAAVDIYDGWVHLQEYAAPPSVAEARATQRLGAMKAALPAVLGIPSGRVVVKSRARQRGKQQYGRQATTDRFFEVQEGQARFRVNLHDYIDTGLFLDHRPMRARITAISSGKRFLNLFCYTGTATVCAAVGGADSSVSVDTSGTYLTWARENLEANRIDARLHALVRLDARQWVQDYRGRPFDLVFCDPPTFSNSKRTARDFEVERDHVALIRDVMRIVAPTGTLVFSTNKRRFKLATELESGFAVEDVRDSTIPIDFRRRSNAHHCWEIRHSEPTPV